MRFKNLLLFIFLFIPNILYCQTNKWLLPISVKDRCAFESLQLTSIGSFGHFRKARPGIPEHLHTGIDIRRPDNNYNDSPIFPATQGKVVSLRDDGPFAQIIIEHKLDVESCVWTVYEHVAGITVSVGDEVNPYNPVARFMNEKELDRYGWQFDHFHFEVLKQPPRRAEPDSNTPFRFFQTYNLVCYTQEDLAKYYYDPFDFFCNDRH